MKTIIGIILILAAVFLGYLGIQKWDKSSKSLSIGKLEISADNTSGRNTAYIYLGGAIILLIGGIVIVKK